jgi:hypothetical protein
MAVGIATVDSALVMSWLAASGAFPCFDLSFTWDILYATESNVV